MIILFHNEGRFAHQLNQFIFLLSLSIEYKRPFHYRTFEEKYFSILDTSLPLIRTYYQKKSLKTTLYYGLYRFLKTTKRNIVRHRKFIALLNYHKSSELLNESDQLHDGLKARKTVITDMMIKEIPKSLAYRSVIRASVQIAESIRKPMDTYLSELRQHADQLVGVHIRRDDYRQFLDGRLFYSNQQYKKLIQHFIAINPNSKTAFIICSDEPVNLLDFEGLPVHNVQRSLAQDFYLLQSVDYIIGPHSIFTLMANYLSDNRLYQVFDPDWQFSMDDFLPCEKLLNDRYLNLQYVEDFFNENENTII
ncbi:MAG: hypothetical protein U0T77_01605 [Chitinophagales bacterium]